MERCAACGKLGDSRSIRRCSRCKVVRYCSTQCQTRDWPRHKPTCGESSVDGPFPGPSGQSSPADPNQTSSATSTAQANAGPSSANPFASLFDGTFYRTPWEQARSRAQAAFPGEQVTDILTGDLDLRDQEVDVENLFPFPLAPFGLPFMPFPFMLPEALPPVVTRLRATSGKVLVLKLSAPLFCPPHLAWLVEDNNGHTIAVMFKIESPAPYFRLQDVQPGHFLCIKRAVFAVQVQQWLCVVVLTDASLVRVFRV